MPDAILSMENVSVAFGGLTAVDDVTMQIGEGERVGVIGANGAGKTTLLNAISAVVRRSGHISFAQTSLDGLPPHKLAWMGIARTFQLAEHFHDFQVVDYLMLGELARARPAILRAAIGLPAVFRQERVLRHRALALLDDLGLGEWATQRLSETPYGIQKLADVCRAALSEPRLLLLDEPTSGTAASDRELIASTFTLIAERGMTTVMVDHDSDFVARVTGRMILMDLGRVIADGTPAEVLGSDAARTAYLGTRSVPEGPSHGGPPGRSSAENV